MKKLSLLLVLILCLSLCACDIGVLEAPPAAKDVKITAGKIEAGMMPKDILVEVTIGGQPVACKVELTHLTGEGFRVMAADEVVPENFYGRLDVYYSLPKGVNVENINVAMECNGGKYDGTGSTGEDENGCVIAWSHAIYGTEPAPSAAVDVQIKAGKIEAGMMPKDVSVEVTIDGQPVTCKVELTRFTDNGFYVMEAEEVVPENFFGRLDVYYSLPEGVDLDSAEVAMECDGGEYDGTGSNGDDENGCVVAWSHAIYGEEPEPQPDPETDPEQTHTHNWVENPSKYGRASCTSDGYQTYECECGESKRETISALGHDYMEASEVPPTCTKEGYWSTNCRRCGLALLNELPATGHSWSEWRYENGRVHIHTCSTCGAEEEENHNVPSGSVTCTECGEDIVN